MTLQEKEELKKKYAEYFKKQYKDIPNQNAGKANDLIMRLSLMASLIDECEEHLLVEGLVVDMPQGEYSIQRENPYTKVLDRSVKTYQSMLKQLEELRPSKTENDNQKAGEALAAFVAKGKPKINLDEFH